VNYRESRSATSESAAIALSRIFEVEAAVRRYFPHLLCAVVLAAFLPMLVVAVTRPISPDGFWNVFMDTQDSWALFFAEYHRDQHPLLYRFVLRAAANVRSSRLIYRSASILPGLATIYVLGLVAARLCRSKTVALFAAAAYGFSASMIDLNCDVRAYPYGSGRDSVTLFFVKQFPDQAGNSKTEPVEKTIRTMAADAQLKVSSILSSEDATFVTFTAG